MFAMVSGMRPMPHLRDYTLRGHLHTHKATLTVDQIMRVFWF